MSRGSGLRSALSVPVRTPGDVAAIVVFGTVLTLGLEAMLDAGRVWTAMVGYFAVYVVYTLGAIRLRRCVLVLQAFALLAVFRLVNLAVPAFVDLTVYWLPLVYLPLLPAAAFAVRSVPATSSTSADVESDADEESDDADPLAGGSVRTGGRTVAALVGRSPRSLALAAPVVLVGGLGLAVAERALTSPPALVPEPTGQASLLLLAVVVLVAVVEELLFRGLLQTALATWLGPPVAVTLAAALFASMQLPESGAAMLVALLAGLLYGGVYEYTDALLAPITAHAVVNALVFVVLPTHGSALSL